MCRSTAAPLMAMAGMAGTAVGVAIAVLREKADRRSLRKEAEEEIAKLESGSESEPDGEVSPGSPESGGEDEERRGSP